MILPILPWTSLLIGQNLGNGLGSKKSPVMQLLSS